MSNAYIIVDNNIQCINNSVSYNIVCIMTCVFQIQLEGLDITSVFYR